MICFDNLNIYFPFVQAAQIKRVYSLGTLLFTLLFRFLFTPLFKFLIYLFFLVFTCLISLHPHLSSTLFPVSYAQTSSSTPSTSLSASPRQLRATRFDGDLIKIDGRLDEGVWETAVESVGFTERKPKPGVKPMVESSVRVLYNQEALYVGVRMNYDPKHPPVAWELRRDNSEVWNDDAITLKIDPRRDRKTTLGFVLNAAGTSLDLIALDNGLSFLIQYDMVWEGESSIQEKAWFAEFKIPFSALPFKVGDENPIPGIALSRDHPARQATDDWILLPPEFGPASALHYGTLVGLKDMSGGRPLVLMPYFGFNGLDASESSVGSLSIGEHISARLGGDGMMNFSEGAWLELSVLTDFAQVDPDDAQINLDRFPLFYPERRPFFLNGTDVFSFGVRGTAQPFFSRRIGLTSLGEEVPLYGGLKIYNRSGQLRYGLLSTLSGLKVEDGLEDGFSSVIVGRGRYEFKRGHIGVILTHITELGREEQGEQLGGETLGEDFIEEGGAGDEVLDKGELGIGVDTRQRLLNTRLEIDGAYSGLITHQEGWHGGAFNGAVRWRGETIQGKMSVLRVDQDYQPQLGFVRRGDYSNIQLTVTRLYYRPTGLNALQFGPTADISWDAAFERDLDRGASFSGSLTSITGWYLHLSAGFSEVIVSDPFLIGDQEIQPGEYQGPKAYLTLRTPFAGARWRASGALEYNGAFFGGDSYTFTTQVNLSISAHLKANVAGVFSLYNLPQTVGGMGGGIGGGMGGEQGGEVQESQQAWNGGLIITPNNLIQVDVVGQFNSQQERWIGLTRLRWRWMAGSDLFLVYRVKKESDDSVYNPETHSLNSSEVFDEQRLMFKIVWRTDRLLK